VKINDIRREMLQRYNMNTEPITYTTTTTTYYVKNFDTCKEWENGWVEGGCTGSPGTRGAPGGEEERYTGPCGGALFQIPNPRRIRPHHEVRKIDRRMRWLSSLHVNNSRRG